MTPRKMSTSYVPFKLLSPSLLNSSTKPASLSQFDITQESTLASKQPVKDLVRSSLVPQIRKSLQKLAPALIAEHGKDLQHPPGSGPSSGVSTPVNRITSSTAAQTNAKPSSTSASTSTSSGPFINTTSLTSTTEFRTTAAELFETFTSPARIAAFTRSPPSIFEGARPGGHFALFGGGVSGEYVTLKEPTEIVQKWRLETWPKGHFSTLRLGFEQDDENNVTNMKVKWEGVPVGEEDSTREKWGEYYVRALKTTFG
jgi:activator of HSP90 ATPase